MDWKFIVSSIIAVLLFAISTILAIKLTNRKKPVWTYETRKIIGIGSDAPPELNLTFGKIPVTNVFQTSIIFFNTGNDTIRKEDVSENIVIGFKESSILRQPFIKAKSKDANKFTVAQIGDNSIELGFKYLDHNDGARIEVIHTDDKDLTCSGNIMGTKGIVKISFLPHIPTVFTFDTFYGVIRMILALAIIIIGFAIILYGIFTSTTREMMFTRLYFPIGFIVAGITFIPEFVAGYRYNIFPKWCK